jgi:hypothetical protein
MHKPTEVDKSYLPMPSLTHIAEIAGTPQAAVNFMMEKGVLPNMRTCVCGAKMTRGF